MLISRAKSCPRYGFLLTMQRRAPMSFTLAINSAQVGFNRTLDNLSVKPCDDAVTACAFPCVVTRIVEFAPFRREPQIV